LSDDKSPSAIGAWRTDGYYFGVFWKRKRDDVPTPKSPQQLSPFEDLRKLALDSTPALAGWSARPKGRRVYGAILDWGLDSGIATLFALDDGTASLYLSSGGGVIGGGFHESVSQAAKRFLLAFEPFVDRMESDLAAQPPERGSTDLRAMTTEGRFSVRATTDEFGNGRHPMSVVFHSGQDLIAELRQVATNGGRLEESPDPNGS
jgi:hypothetical protein